MLQAKPFLLLLLLTTLAWVATAGSVIDPLRWTKGNYCAQQTAKNTVTADTIKYCSPVPAPTCINGAGLTDDEKMRKRYVAKRNEMKNDAAAIRKYYTGLSGTEDMRPMLLIELEEVIDLWYSTHTLAVETVSELFGIQSVPDPPNLALALTSGLLGVLSSVVGIGSSAAGAVFGIAQNVLGMVTSVVSSIQQEPMHNTATTAGILNDFRSKLLLAKVEMKMNRITNVNDIINRYRKLTTEADRNAYLKELYNYITFVHQNAASFKDVVNVFVGNYIRKTGARVVVDYSPTGDFRQWKLEGLPNGISGRDVAKLWAKINGGCMKLPSNVPLILRQERNLVTSQVEYTGRIGPEENVVAYQLQRCQNDGYEAAEVNKDTWGICVGYFFRKIAANPIYFNTLCLNGQHSRTDSFNVYLSEQHVELDSFLSNLRYFPGCYGNSGYMSAYGPDVCQTSTETCPSPIATPSYVPPAPERIFATIGGGGGTRVFAQHYADKMTRIKCYGRGGYLKRMEISLATGTTVTIGTDAGDLTGDLVLANDEWIDGVNHHSGDFVDRIRFVTTAGKQMFCGGGPSDTYTYWIRFPYTWVSRMEFVYARLVDSIRFIVPDRTPFDPFFTLEDIRKSTWIPRASGSDRGYSTTSVVNGRTLAGVFCRWFDNTRVREMTFIYNDGSQDVIGDAVGNNYAGILMRRDEYISGVEYLGTNANQGSISRLKFVTNKGRVVPCAVQNEGDVSNGSWYAAYPNPDELVYGMNVNYGLNIDYVELKIARKIAG